jgi:outer membrane protein W
MKQTHAMVTTLFILLSSGLFSQNLVVNGELEDPTHYPNYAPDQKGEVELFKQWYIPTKEAPEYYYDSQIKTIKPIDGLGYVGLRFFSTLNAGRIKKPHYEAIQGQLSSTLQAGKTYKVCVDIALHRTSNWAVKNMGIQFSANVTNNLSVAELENGTADISIQPSASTTNMVWEKYCAKYVARGDEKSIIFSAFGPTKAEKLQKLGVPFHPDQDGFEDGAYYMVDNFIVTPFDEKKDCNCEEKMVEEPIAEEVVEEVVEQPKYPEEGTLFLIDESGLMCRKSTKPLAYQQIMHQIDSLPADHRIAILTYANRTRIIFDGTRAELDCTMVSGFTQHLEMSGQSDYCTALEKTREILWNVQRKNMIWITGKHQSLSNQVKKFYARQRHNFSSFTLFHVNGNPNDFYEWKQSSIQYLSLKNIDKDIVKLPKTLPLREKDTKLEAPRPVSAFADFTPPVPQKKVDPLCDSGLAAKQQFTFIIDASASMNKTGMRDLIKTRLLDWVEPLENYHVISIIVFSSEAKLIFKGSKQQLAATGVAQLIDSLDLDGSTQIDKGLLMGYQQIEPNAFNQLILISDGSFNVTPEIRALFESHRAKTTNLLFFHVNGNEDQAKLFNKMAVKYIPIRSKDFDAAIRKHVTPRSIATSFGAESIQFNHEKLLYAFVLDHDLERNNIGELRRNLSKHLSYLPDESPVIIMGANANSAPLYVGLKKHIDYQFFAQKVVADKTLGSQKYNGLRNVYTTLINNSVAGYQPCIFILSNQNRFESDDRYVLKFRMDEILHHLRDEEVQLKVSMGSSGKYNYEYDVLKDEMISKEEAGFFPLNPMLKNPVNMSYLFQPYCFKATK